MPVSNQRRATLAAAVIVGMLVASMSAYTVKPGDTLSEIAADHGVSTADLASANSLIDPNRIYAGQSLSIPGQSGATSSAIATHVVQPGESLALIALRYNTTVADIAAANGILNTNLVYAGTQLIVSGQGPQPSIPTSTGGGSHIVAAGETLSGLASV